VADEDRSHDGTTGKTGSHLPPHPILRVVETTTFFLCCQPARSDDSEEELWARASAKALANSSPGWMLV
jgi:hypothetical protein